MLLSVLTIIGMFGGYEMNRCTYTEALTISGFAAVGAVIGWLCGYETE